MSNQWHNFVRSSEDDSECSHADCGLIVCDEALNQIAVACPAKPCTDLMNSDGRCVMAPSATGPMCTYCGQRGSYFDPEDDDDEDTA